MTGSDEVAHDREMSQARFELTSATLASEPDVWVQNVLIASPQLQPAMRCSCLLLARVVHVKNMGLTAVQAM